MRALVLVLALLGASVAPARAAPSEMMPGVKSDGSEPGVLMSVVIGHISSDTYGDNFGGPPASYSGWLYGLSFRGEVVNMVTSYGGVFGATFDLDAFLVTPGAITSSPDGPPLSIVYLGFTPALALGVFKTQSRKYALSLELGAPLNTDFYGLSAGGFAQLKWLYLGYRIRSGKGWRGQEVLDERVRFGLGDNKSLFLGFEVIDGYSEDELGRANLGSILKGSYTQISLIVSKGP